MKTLIDVENVVYDYSFPSSGGIRALDSLFLEVYQGEYLAIIGPNGSGKSTLARLLNAILLPTSGEVVVDGFNTAREEYRFEIRRRVGMVFQNPDNQIVATTVEEDVAFGLENLGIESSIIRQKVPEALEVVGLSSLTGHSPHFLSGGQKQRLAIAGVLAMRPKCLVLDEPTTMMDPRGRHEVLKTIKDLNSNEDITVVHITHFMSEVIEADRVLLLNEGEVYYQGTPEQLFSGEIDLNAVDLELPTLSQLVHFLNNNGLHIPRDILKADQLVSYLCS